jgi:cytosine/adenosine deaminase-related metal-dependent hydrolase
MITFLDGDVSGHGRTNLRVVEGRVASVGAPPVPGDIVVELHGDRVLPGLINAHDHLQLNNFPRLKYRETHLNVSEWIADIAAHRETDTRLTEPHAVVRDARLWHGAVKNLLSGVTTVVHHDPLYPVLRTPGFPVRVLADYGWAHSLALDGNDTVRRSHRSTPGNWPWFIHAGEGVDEEAGREFAVLESMGCVTANARFIHGVAFDAAARARLAEARAGLIWCPASNLFLFGKTADISGLIGHARVALGSDSRLSGSNDLLSELREAHASGLVPEAVLETLVTTASASLLRLPDRGLLREGALADIVVLPRDMPLWKATRADLRCVMLGGIMAYGDLDYARSLMPAGSATDVTVDGKPKRLQRSLVEFLRHETLETGRAA